MSWNWNSDREEKTYDIKGTVTISTEEYKDLINEVYEVRAAGQKEHDDWYNERRRADDLEKKMKVMEDRLNVLEAWLVATDMDNNSPRAQFSLWRARQEEQDNE